MLNYIDTSDLCSHTCVTNLCIIMTADQNHWMTTLCIPQSSMFICFCFVFLIPKKPSVFLDWYQGKVKEKIQLDIISLIIQYVRKTSGSQITKNARSTWFCPKRISVEEAEQICLQCSLIHYTLHFFLTYSHDSMLNFERYSLLIIYSFHIPSCKANV